MPSPSMKSITSSIDQITNANTTPTQTRSRHQVSQLHSSIVLTSLSLPTRPGSRILTDPRSEGSLINHALRWIGKNITNQRRCLIDILPDDVLLAIFDLCADEISVTKERFEAWQTLVHVCRQWRSLVFGSPRRLNLRLVCSAKTPARDTLDIWPALPLFVQCYDDCPIENVDGIVAVLERSNRVCQIDLIRVSNSHLEKVSAAMQDTFPELARLQLWSFEETAPVLPDSFLGGSPRLRDINFSGIPFPGLPKLLFSATHLTDLRLFDILHSGYISPDKMVTALSTLIRLRILRLEFRSPQSRPDRANRHLPPPTRFVLPFLTFFSFKGVSEYLDDLVARIDAPRLGSLYITFFNQIVFDTPQCVRFFSRTPRLKACQETNLANVSFGDSYASVRLSISRLQELEVRVLCRELDWQVSSLEQVCASCLPPLSILKGLSITERQHWQPYWQDNIENTLWLELLHPFTAVNNLHLSEEIARRIVPALQELVGGRTTEVLPALQKIFLDGTQPSVPVQEGIEQLVTTRQVAGHPIALGGYFYERRQG